MKKIFIIIIFLASVSQCFAETDFSVYGMLGFGTNPTVIHDYRTGLDRYREEINRLGYPYSEKKMDRAGRNVIQAGLLFGNSQGIKLDFYNAMYYPRRQFEIQHPVYNTEQDTIVGSDCYSIRSSFYYSFLENDRIKVNIYGGLELCRYSIRDESGEIYFVTRQLRSSNYYIGPSAGLMLKFAVLRFEGCSIDVLADGWVTWAYYDEYMGRKSCWNESFAGSIGIGMTVENVW